MASERSPTPPSERIVGLDALRGFALLGILVIYAFGLLRLAAFVGMERVIALGLAPFILGDLVKLVGATLILHNVDDLFE